jgi:N-acetylmuramoyl-L-alanine amidase
MNVTLSRTALLAVDSMTCPAVAVEVAPARGPDGKVTAEPDDPGYQARVAATLANAILAWRTEGRQP